MEAHQPFDYEGDEALRRPIAEALQRVVDPEMAISIVDVGLVYRVGASDAGVQVRMTMTSAACPLSDVVIEDVQSELRRVLPSGTPIEVELCWDPPWTPERLSPKAKLFMGW